MSETKVALVLGVTGQTGSYLVDLLLVKGYRVHGLTHTNWQETPPRLEHIVREHSRHSSRFKLHQGDINELPTLTRLLSQIKPHEVYNLAAQSSVHASFTQPISTVRVVGIAVFNVLEAIRAVDPTIKLFQASSSEMFGRTVTIPQNEKTPPSPCSPYAYAKLMAHHAVISYREAYGMYTCSGILYNHESSRRSSTFVSQKIARAVVRIKYGAQDRLELGNLNSERDWGHAKEFVECIWRMLQLENPEDFVVATGVTHTVREFVQRAFEAAGMRIEFQGEGLMETGVLVSSGSTVVVVNPDFFRPSEPNLAIGDITKATNVLGWKPQVSLKELVAEMVTAYESTFVSHAYN
eukprot:CAMPEP_0179709256 /NCGR_PEP_ID=MMETSP0937-20121108/5794_1 /TAXON_ID=548131 ORGANISM="Ostreococcus mediterraneus, Strain clade-D-RCC2593" /NCGR_SAMPLE_ID=MMETSP0937 /ASSEMBLY_ACC=CAM_ASM_000575 /LENGTH=350 /DNA_ID=CAMNT_0021582605 /DNA_START=86 /DNA_END=1138 /DNA_ORIENTATION=-